MKIFKKSITAMHRKLKKLQKDVIDGKITRKDVEMSVSSWIGYTKRFNAWHSRTNVLKMYKRLFGGNKWKII